jgi:hypothetical protein
MDVLRLLKRYVIGQSSKKISLVEGLPNEVIQHIATFLPLSSAALLALCSHHIYFALGTGYWERLARTQHQRDRERHSKEMANGEHYHDIGEPPATGEREELLSLLERDLHDLTFLLPLCHSSSCEQQVQGSQAVQSGAVV